MSKIPGRIMHSQLIEDPNLKQERECREYEKEMRARDLAIRTKNLEESLKKKEAQS